MSNIFVKLFQTRNLYIKIVLLSIVISNISFIFAVLTMKKTLFYIAFSLLTIGNLFAQQPISGYLIEEGNNEPLGQATVQLFNQLDSTFITGTTSNDKGHFILPAIKPGKYNISISFIGLAPVSQTIEVKGAPVDLGKIIMGQNENTLEEFVVRGVPAQMGVKNDTLEYNAVAFKVTQNAVTEDLLKKMPGIEIDDQGRVFVNGEEVKKIRINGKRFFGDNTKMATKNLPADLIDKIQIIDEQSEMAKLTGFADGETVKMINITIREDKKKGLFANVYGGYGDNGRYEANGIANWISGDNITTILAGSNNTNNSRFDGIGDLPVNIPGMKVSKNQMTQGVTTSNMIGFNGSFDLNRKMKLETNASFGAPSTYTNQNSNRETTSSSGAKSFREYSGQVDRFSRSYSAGFRLEWKINPTATLIIDPDFSYSDFRYSSQSQSITLKESGDTTIVQKSHSSYQGDTYRAYANITFSKKFNKKGRTLSFNVRTDVRRYGLEDGINYIHKVAYQGSIATPNKPNIPKPKQALKDSISQIFTEDTPTESHYFRASYIEPVGKGLRAELSYAVRLNKNDLERFNYSYDRSIQDYDTEYDSTSNVVHSRLITQLISLNLRNYKKKYNYTIGITAEPSSMHTTFPLAGEPVDRTVFNIAPSANLIINFNKKKYLKFDYRAYTSQPSATQLRRDTNDTNPSYLRIGNPELRPRFTHNLKSTYSAYNRKNFSLLTVNVNGSYSNSAIVNQVSYDDDGIQTTKPVNVNGVYNVYGNVLYNRPLFNNRLTISTNTPAAYNNNIGFTKRDNVKEYVQNNIRTLRLGERLKFMWQNSLMELSGGAEISYVKSKNDVNERQNTETYDWEYFGSVLFRLPFDFTLDTDVSAAYKKGYSAGFDTEEIIWNVTLEKLVFKNKKGIIGLKVYDLLQQRLSMRRVIGENYIDDIRYNTLKDYFLVTFAYKIDFWGTRKKN